MPEDLNVYYKFRNRETGKINDVVVVIKNVENHAPSLKKYFDIHDYKIVEKRILRTDEYEKWKRENRMKSAAESASE